MQALLPLELAGADSYFRVMKRALIFLLMPMALLRYSVLAQDVNNNPPQTAAAVAAREDAEDRYKRMAADLQAVQSDNEALHSKIAALEQEIQTLRDAQAHAADNTSLQDQLKRLSDAIQEVDKKRMEDKDAISKEIRDSVGRLELSLGNSPPPPVHSSQPETKSTPVADSPAVENGYSYTIQPGDTLGEVLKAYNKDFKSKGLKPVTLRQAMEANPQVNWGRLRVGQKIVIPRPDGG